MKWHDYIHMDSGKEYAVGDTLNVVVSGWESPRTVPVRVVRIDDTNSVVPYRRYHLWCEYVNKEDRPLEPVGLGYGD